MIYDHDSFATTKFSVTSRIQLHPTTQVRKFGAMTDTGNAKRKKRRSRRRRRRLQPRRRRTRRPTRRRQSLQLPPTARPATAAPTLAR